MLMLRRARRRSSASL